MKEDVVEGMEDFLIEPVHLNLKSCFIYDTHCCGVVMNLNEVDNEDEQSCVETPMDDVDGDIPMTDEWVDFTYEVIWYVFKCRPVAGCRWSIWNVEDVHGLVMGEGLGAEMVMRLELLQDSFVDVPKLDCFELVGSDCKPSCGRIGG